MNRPGLVGGSSAAAPGRHSNTPTGARRSCRSAPGLGRSTPAGPDGPATFAEVAGGSAMGPDGRATTQEIPEDEGMSSNAGAAGLEGPEAAVLAEWTKTWGQLSPAMVRASSLALSSRRSARTRRRSCLRRFGRSNVSPTCSPSSAGGSVRRISSTPTKHLPVTSEASTRWGYAVPPDIPTSRMSISGEPAQSGLGVAAASNRPVPSTGRT